MSREIKLPRVWDGPKKEMLYPKWKTDYIGGKLMSLYIYETNDKRGHSSLSWVLHQPEFEVMWPTGMKDKKRTEEFPEGQEIYRGDIYKVMMVHGMCGSPDVFRTELVEQDCGCFLLPSGYVSLDGLPQVEVIGNIHQHPKLLEENQ